MELDTPGKRLQWVRERKYPGKGGAKEAADALGVPEGTYYGHENGSRGLYKNAKKYAAFFGCSAEWLLYGTGTWDKGTVGNPLAGLSGEQLNNALRYIGTLKEIEELKRKK